MCEIEKEKFVKEFDEFLEKDEVTFTGDNKHIGISDMEIPHYFKLEPESLDICGDEKVAWFSSPKSWELYQEGGMCVSLDKVDGNHSVYEMDAERIDVELNMRVEISDGNCECEIIVEGNGDVESMILRQK